VVLTDIRYIDGEQSFIDGMIRAKKSILGMGVLKILISHLADII